MIGYLRGILLEKTGDTVVIDAGGVGYEVTVPASSICILPQVGHEAALCIHTHVREDQIRLFGFASRFDRRIFEALLSVSSVGPKAAVTLLGPYDGVELAQAIVDGKSAALVSIPGVGAKTAERLMLELKSKLQRLLALHEDEERFLPAAAQQAPAGNGRKPASTAPEVTLFETPDDVTPGKKTKPTPALRSLEKRMGHRRLVEDLRGALETLGYKERQVLDVVSGVEKRLQGGEDLSLESALREALKTLSGRVLRE